MENNDRIIFLVIITGRKQKNLILNDILENGVRLVNTSYGKGTVCANYLLNTFGLVPEKNKSIISCVSTYSKINAVMNMLNEKYNFDKPNTGIAFTVPVEKVSF